MAEHDEKDFEHRFEKSFKSFDENINISEIPDAQSIFEKAESRKNTISMKKCSKYAAVAAAIVLICVSAPMVADAFAKNSPDVFLSENFSVDDGQTQNSFYDECCSESTENETPEIMDKGDFNEDVAPKDDEKILSTLKEFFNESRKTNSEYYEEPSENSSQPENDSFIIEEQFNKKRSVELVVEEDSVSVRLFDDSLEKEVISEFWIEGNYKTAALDGDNYVITLEKVIEEEDLETGFYLPMAGDRESGNYIISADEITVSDDVTYGIISMSVELNIATGEYKIYARLI